MPDYGEALNQVSGQRQRATSLSVGTVEDDPEQAAEAIRLGRATGVDPSIVYGDVDGFKRKSKGSITSSLVDDNPHLQDYINSHPMAAKVSNDDWAQLDKISEKLDWFIPHKMIAHDISNFFVGYKKGVGEEPLLRLLDNQPTRDFVEKHFGWAALGAMGISPVIAGDVLLRYLMSGPIHGVGEAVAGAAEKAGYPELAEPARRGIPAAADVIFLEAMGRGGAKPMPGTSKPTLAETTQALRITINKGIYERVKLEDLKAKAKSFIDADEPTPRGVDPIFDKMIDEQSKEDVKRIDELHSETQKANTLSRDPEFQANFANLKANVEVHIDANAVRLLYEDKIPAPGDGLLGDLIPDLAKKLDTGESTGGYVTTSLGQWLTAPKEVYDALKDDFKTRGLTRNEIKEVKELEAAKKEALGEAKPEEPTNVVASRPPLRTEEPPSEWKQRFERFIQGHEDGKPRSVEEAAWQREQAKGEWVNNLIKEGWTREQAEHHIENPIKGAYENPSAIQAPKLSATEIAAKRWAASKPRPSRPIEDVVRSSAGMDPMFMPKQLLLKREKGQPAAGEGHNFAITDENGRPVGQLAVSLQDAGKALYIEWIGGLEHMVGPKGETANVFGTRLMLGMFRNLVAEYPGIEKIVGDRISGAREKAGAVGMVEIPAKVFREELGADAFTKELQDLVDSGIWRSLGGESSRLVPKEWTPEQQTAIKAGIQTFHEIVSRGAKIAPGKRVQFEGREVRGLYLQYEKDLPVIAFALEHAGREGEVIPVDVVGTVRHEAGHHLRRAGFWTEDEWSTLVDAATKYDWLKKHDIETRYKGENIELRIEEAVMDEFSEWRRTEDPAHPVAKLFQKLKALLDQIMESMRKALGFDPTYKDLFAQALRGETGRREPKPPSSLGAFGREVARQETFNRIDAFRPAYEKIKERQGGIGTINISDLIKESGFDAEVVKGVLQQEAAEGNVSLHRGSQPWAKLTKEQQDAAIKVNDEVFVTVTFPSKPRTAASRPKEPQLPGLTRQEDLPLFKPTAIGLDAAHYAKLHEKGLEVLREAELYQMEKALKVEQRRQTKEWKENLPAVKAEAEESISAEPGIGVLRYLKEGMLYGEDTHTRPKFNFDSLTKEQKEALPENLVGENGIQPDDVAGLFGYPSGKEMIDGLLERLAEQGEATHREYIDALVKYETERLMQDRFGQPGEDILDDIRTHILSPKQMELLHEETVAAGMKAGSEMSYTLNEAKSWVRNKFKDLQADGVSSRKFLEQSGRLATKIIRSDIDGKWTDSFKMMQQRQFAALMAKEALTFEKEKKKFDRQMEKFRNREVSGVEQEYTNMIHLLMTQAEIPLRRELGDIAHEMQATGYSSFEHFVSSKNGAGYDLDVPDSILSGDIKPREQMTVEEFRAFSDTTKQLEHIGRAVNKIEVAGKEQDFADWKEGVFANMETLIPRQKEKQGRLLYAFDSEMVRVEEIVRDLDIRRELGPLYNGLIRPMMEAKHKEFQLQEKLVKTLTELRTGNKEWRATLNDAIPQNFFIDPETGLPFNLTREQLINIALNFGNKSSVEKFTQGWFGKDGAENAAKQFSDLFQQHLTQGDVDFIKKLSGIFEEWRKDADNMYRNLNGIGPKWLDIPDGGWYWPVIYDRHYSDINTVIERVDPNALMGNNYFRATTANGYTQARTGYVGRIEFQNPMEQLATRMQQYIHDISYRPAVMQAAKIIYDKDIKAAVRLHYGSEYEKQLDPWLKSIASHYNINEADISATNAFLRRARMNLVVHALGLNFKQWLTPDVGVLTPMTLWRAAKFLDADTEFAMANSREIPHTLKVMDRDFRESLDRTIATQGYEGIQATAARWAFTPMAQLSKRFRVATFTERYKDARARGLNHTDAVEVADIAVRERHGATGLPDMPAIMRGSETRKFLTLFYGFGNATYNWQRQIPGAIRRGDWNTVLAAAWGAVLVPSAFGMAFYNSRKEDDSWFKIIAKGLVLQGSQTLWHARELANVMLEDQHTRVPLTSAALALKSAATDAYRYFEGKKVTKPIQHAANVVGIAAGLPLAQAGRTSQFLRDVKTGAQDPRGFQEWIRGIIHGEAKLKKGSAR